MSSQSKDNTCPTCKGFLVQVNMFGKVIACVTCGSGQQEDTGHPTAESPDAQPLDNVSESSRTPEHNPHYCIHYLGSLSSENAYQQLRKFRIEATVATTLARLFAEWHKDDINHLHEALPSNNASESDQSPSPSEQEDKPTTPCADDMAHPWRPTKEGGWKCDYCGATNSKPEKPTVQFESPTIQKTAEIVNDKNELHKTSPENVESDQLEKCEQYPECGLTQMGCNLLQDIVLTDTYTERRELAIQLRKLEGQSNG